MLVMMIIRRSQCKDRLGRDMRYEAEWLLDCLLLRVKSPGMYESLRRQWGLPFPSKETLRKMLGAMSTTFGFNEFALEAIEKALKDLPLEDRFGSLIWDEMKCTEEFVFDPKSHQFDGHIQLDNIVDTVVDHDHDYAGSAKQQKLGPLADHALVFIFRPLKAKWIQPFAVFAGKNAVPGKDLYRLLMKALIVLEERGARVLSTVCDGAQSNASVWSACGIFGISDGTPVKTFIQHPTADTPVFFLRDAPHLMKCIRNFALGRNEVQVSS